MRLESVSALFCDSREHPVTGGETGSRSSSPPFFPCLQMFIAPGNSPGLDEDRPMVVLHVDVHSSNVPGPADTTTTTIRRLANLDTDPGFEVETVLLTVLTGRSESDVLKMDILEVVRSVLVLGNRTESDPGTTVACDVAGGDEGRVGFEGETVVSSLVDHAVWESVSIVSKGGQCLDHPMLNDDRSNDIEEDSPKVTLCEE